MSQKTKGIHALLSNTFFYSLVQRIMSATSFRKKIIKKFIKKKNVKILEIGCGPAEILSSLSKVKYYGFDINPIYIKHAKKKYQKRGKFFCKKFTTKDIKKLPKFDYVLLLGILHHLNDKEANKLMLLVKKVLKKKGNIISLDNIFIDNQNFIAKFLIHMDRGNNVRSKVEYLNILKNHFKKIKTKIYHQKFIPYTYFVCNCVN